jgi:nucleoside-diphosphate-sugar epimerase
MPSTDPSSGTPIEGAVALVTGGHRGFGRALVDELLERGAAKVYATSPHRNRNASRGLFPWSSTSRTTHPSPRQRRRLPTSRSS